MCVSTKILFVNNTATLILFVKLPFHFLPRVQVWLTPIKQMTHATTTAEIITAFRGFLIYFEGHHTSAFANCAVLLTNGPLQSDDKIHGLGRRIIMYVPIA